MKSKEIIKGKIRKLPAQASQVEIIRRINASTKKSYKLFELLSWNRDRNEK